MLFLKLIIMHSFSKTFFPANVFSNLSFQPTYRKIYFTILVPIILCAGLSCSSAKHLTGNEEIGGLKFLSEYDIPFNKNFKNTIIGGLSGIDYNPASNVYYMISDDRSERNPARFYEAHIIINNNKIDSVEFADVKFLKNSSGTNYPNSKTDPYHTPDPEALRYNPKNNTMIWSGEGERIVKPGKSVLEDPAITEITPNGNYIDTFQLPTQQHMHSYESGPRQNSVFEGVTFADDYKTLFVSVEEPLFDDGSRAGLNDSTSVTRILQFDMDTKKTKAQYAYVLDPVAQAPIPENAFKINGIPDILSIGKNEFLVIERSFSSGRAACTIKVFLTDIASADNIDTIASLKNKANIKPAIKIVSHQEVWPQMLRLRCCQYKFQGHPYLVTTFLYMHHFM